MAQSIDSQEKNAPRAVLSFWRNPWFAIPVLLFLNGCAALLLVLPYGQEIVLFNSWRVEPLNTFFRLCTMLGEPLAFTIAGLFAAVWRFRYALVIALGGMVVTPASYLLKEKFDIDRPITYFEKQGLRPAVAVVPDVYLNAGRTSFPSGHTMAAFGLYGAVALLSGRARPRLSLACVLAAALVAVSRIFLVQHFLVDIMAGAVFGLLIALLVVEADSRFFKKWKVLDQGFLRK